jgi:hypothetical protein
MLVLAGTVATAGTDDLTAALKERYRVSRIEVQNVARSGDLASAGIRLRIDADGVPAKPFRVMQLNTKSPRFHARDYARIVIASGEPVTVVPSELRLPKGTEVVVLDIKVKGDTVRLFTHTAEPVSYGDGRRAYGCTEFVFRFDHAPLAAADAGRVQQAIERWLSPTS